VNRLSARAPRRGFVWALAASLALHGVLLALAPAHLARPPAAVDPAPLIEVRLASPPETAPAPAPPVAVVAPRAARAIPPAAAAPPPADPPPATFAMPPTAPVEAPPAEAPTAEATTVEAATVEAATVEAGTVEAATAESITAGQPPAAESAAAPGLEQTTAAADPPPLAPETAIGTAPAEAADPPPGSVTFPRNGRLEYAVTFGEPPSPIGRAVYVWEASETAYHLSLTAQTTGLVGLLRRVRVEQVSHGRITPQGLRPEAFTMDRGPNARNEFARFDWAAKQLTFGYPDAIQTGTLAEGAQDVLSLILQFAFVPIVDGRRDVLLTTGRRLYVQSYERVGEEVVETVSGAWRAWHLRRVRARPTDEGYDMWLAIDRPYLPVRIRWTDRNGRTMSATVDTIRLARD